MRIIDNINNEKIKKNPYLSYYNKIIDNIPSMRYICKKYTILTCNNNENIIVFGYSKKKKMLIEFCIGYEISKKMNSYVKTICEILKYNKCKIYLFDPINFKYIATKFIIITDNKNDYSSLNDEWIAASKTRNALLEDYCLDYYEMYNIKKIGDKPQKKQKTNDTESNKNGNNQIVFENSFTDYTMLKGLEFENNIVDKLYDNNKFIQIGYSWQANLDKKYEQTIQAMKDGYEIIYQGVLRNYETKVYGCVDILINSKSINKIFNDEIISKIDEEIPSKFGDYHYRVIDIKWSSLILTTENDNIRNSHCVKPYKSQIYLYNKALAYMQNYESPCAYILCKSCRIEKTINKKKETKMFGSLEKLGIIDFENFDNKYKQLSNDAVEWLRYLRNNKDDLQYLPPNHEKLYPNMSNQSDGKFRKLKSDIAKKIGEITLLWNCGVTQRKNAFKNNIKSIYDDKINSEKLGVYGNKKDILDKIININKNKNKFIDFNKSIHDDNTGNWKDYNNHIYLDIETIEPLLSGMNTTIIFMIGIGYIENLSWNFKNFVIEDLSELSQYKTLHEFLEFIYLLKNKNNQKMSIFHWSNFDSNAFKKVFTKFDIGLCSFIDFDWIDGLNIIRGNEVVFNGAFNFSLKSIGSALIEMGFINETWENSILNGMDAMYYAWKYYNKTTNEKIMDNIAKYNEIDCKMMYYIFKILKNIISNKI